jgi:pSer/pThr/pTyr-binding forkhead associated (FHA) protein
MRAIFEVVEGPLAGRRIEIQTGQSLAFGRTTKSDIPIPGDGYMSGRHFEVQNMGDACVVRDCGSSNGTFVNGARVTEQPLNALDMVAAGSSKFRLHIEATGETDFSKTSTIPSPQFFEATIQQNHPSTVMMPPPIPQGTIVGPPPMPPGAAPGFAPGPPPFLAPQQTATVDPWQGFAPRELKILKAMFDRREPVYAILDATKDMLVRAFVEACGEPAMPLTEALIQNRSGIGSYLLSVPPTSTKLLDVLVKDGWGKGWGVYCSSGAGMDSVASHLRNTINVYTSSGLPFQLKLQDPNLLRWFLPGLMPHEATAVMGPITRFVAESGGGREVASFTAGAHGLAVDLVKLEA